MFRRLLAAAIENPLHVLKLGKTVLKIAYNNPSGTLGLLRKPSLATASQLLTGNPDGLMPFLEGIASSDHPELLPLLDIWSSVILQDLLYQHFYNTQIQDVYQIPQKGTILVPKAFDEKTNGDALPTLTGNANDITSKILRCFTTNPSDDLIQEAQLIFFTLKDLPAMLGTNSRFLTKKPVALNLNLNFPIFTQEVPFYFQAILVLITPTTPAQKRCSQALQTLLNANKSHINSMLNSEQKITEELSKGINARTSPIDQIDFLSDYSNRDKIILKSFLQWLFSRKIQPTSDELSATFTLFQRVLKNSYTDHKDMNLTLAEVLINQESDWDPLPKELSKLPQTLLESIKSETASIQKHASKLMSQIPHESRTDPPQDELIGYMRKLAAEQHIGPITAYGLCLHLAAINHHSPTFSIGHGTNTGQDDYDHLLSDSVHKQIQAISQIKPPRLQIQSEFRQNLAKTAHILRQVPIKGASPINHAFLLHAHLTAQDPTCSSHLQNLAARYVHLNTKTEDTLLPYTPPVTLNSVELTLISSIFSLFKAKSNGVEDPVKSLEFATKLVTTLTGSRPQKDTPNTKKPSVILDILNRIRENYNFEEKVNKKYLVSALIENSKKPSKPNPINPILYQYIIPAVFTVTALTIFSATFIPLMLSSLKWSVMTVLMTSLGTTAFSLSILGLFSYINFKKSGLDDSINQLKSWAPKQATGSSVLSKEEAAHSQNMLPKKKAAQGASSCKLSASRF